MISIQHYIVTKILFATLNDNSWTCVYCVNENYPSRCTYEIYRGQSLITDLSKTYSIFSKTSQGHSSIDLTYIGLLFVLGKYALRSFKKATPSFSIAPTPYVT